MPPATSKSTRPLVLVCGEDEFAVKQRAKVLFQQWSAECGGFGDDTIDGSVSNGGEAMAALRKFREAMQTLPFFGSAKVVWLRDCNFLGDDRVSASALVTETLAQIADELKAFDWNAGVRVLISAGKVDKRRTFYKTVEKLGTVENLAGWSVEDKDWAEQAEMWVRKAVAANVSSRSGESPNSRSGLQAKQIDEDALAALVSSVGPNARLLASEVEKVCLYVGDRSQITAADVAAICTRNKTARAFAVADALGDRDLPKLLKRLDEELWDMQFDRDKSEIGLLYGLITKVRAMLFAREMVREGWVKADADYGRFKASLDRVPADQLPADRRFNPLAMHPFVLHRALQQSRNYSSAELIRAMNILLECNRRLVSSGLEESLVLQQALAEIVGAARSSRVSSERGTHVGPFSGSAL
ncbi:MAG TPA: DNA polymerase III subunit delta [Verrucomicrobiae bacterium]